MNKILRIISLFTLIFSFQTTLADFGTLDTAPKGNNFAVDVSATTGFIAQTFWGNGETINAIDIYAARVSGIPTADLRARIVSGVIASTTDLQYSTNWTLEASTSIPAVAVHSRDDDGQYATTTFTLSTPFTTDSTKYYALVIDTADHDSGGTHASPYYDVITDNPGGISPGDTDFYTGGTIGMQQANPSTLVPDCFREYNRIRFGSLGCGAGGSSYYADLNYYANADLLFMLRTSTTTTTEVGCVTDCNSNVLFLPGIMGSTLYRYDPIMGSSTKVWEPGLFGEGTEQVEQLHMNPELNTSNNTDIYAKDILREDWSGSNYYESFASALDSISGTGKPIKEWEGIGYDWRLAPEDIIANGKKEGDYISYLKATSSPYIIQELRRLAANSKTGKVTIVAHSYGGLVTKALMNTLGAEGANLVDKIIFVAVPQVGTPQAIAGMLYGKNQDLGFGGVAVSEEEAQQLAETLPMGFTLLPSKGYFSTVQEPVLTLPNEDHFASWRDLYGADIQNWDEMHNFLTSTSNRTLLSNLRVTDGAPPLLNHTASMRALATHDTLDAWVPPTGVAVTQIAGWGIPKTVKGVNFTGYDIGDSYCAVDDIVCHSTSDWALIRGFDTTMDGDGTVVTPSALWTSTSTGALNYWVNLDKYNNNPPFSFFRLDKEHGDILEVPELVTFLTDNLTQITKPLTTYKYLSTEVPKYKSPRLRYSLHSPLTLDLYDDQGRHTGVSTTTGQIEEQIPGTYFTQFGEVKYLFTEASTTSHIVMNGYATGTFTFIAEQLQGDTLLASTTWKDIPTTPDTQVTLTTISDISTISPMSIDNNSDGIIDTTLAPRQNDIVTLDITAPEALITFSTSTNAITIQGIDESGTTTLSSTTTYPTLKKNQKQYKGTATTTVTITDQSNNITILTYTEELPSPTKRDVINLTSISYNGAVQNLGTTTLKYKWANNKTTGAYTMFASTFSTSTVVIESHYRPKKNQTLIMNTPIDLDDGDTDDTVDTRPIKTKLQGFVIPSVVTKRGRVNVSY